MQIVLLVAAVVSLVVTGEWATDASCCSASPCSTRCMGAQPGGQGRSERRRPAEDDDRQDPGAARWAAGRRSPPPSSCRATSSLFEAGDRIPADGRLIKAATLEIDESALTGESAPVPKESTPVECRRRRLGDRVDMAYMNTRSRAAQASWCDRHRHGDRGRSYLGHAADQPRTKRRRSRKQLDALTNQIIDHRRAGAGHRRSRSATSSMTSRSTILFLAGVAFAIAAIPTGLPAVVTTLLSIGTRSSPPQAPSSSGCVRSRPWARRRPSTRTRPAP